MSEHDDPTLKVARDLSAILELDAMTGDHLDRIDSAVMGHVGPVANPEAWQHQIDARDELGRDTSHVADHDDGWEPLRQTLEYWTGQWRAEHGRESDLRPSVASEVAYLRSVLDWAYDQSGEWRSFADDIHAAKLRLEDDLHAGTRAERGIPCIYGECRGVRLVRQIVRRGDGRAAELQPALPESLAPTEGSRSARTARGAAEWVYTDWVCPVNPEHRWDDDRYRGIVTEAQEATKVEIIGGETFSTIEYAVRQTGRGYRTIQTWANRGKVRKACIITGRRRNFVSLDDVLELTRKARAA